MKLSLNALKDLVDIENINIEDLKEAIYLKIMEIDDSGYLVDVKGLKIGKVLTCIKHPEADKLQVCTVDVGDEVLNIVCGAPNCKKDIKVIVAPNNTKLPDLLIKKSKIRGIESNGMLCSLSELGIDTKYQTEEQKSGILVLDDNAPIGEDPLEYLKLNDYFIELGITPNRSDLFSHRGLAYDISAVFQRDLKKLNISFTEDKEQNDLSVEITTDKDVKYSSRVIKNIKVTDSPWWLKSRLIAANIRPINNIVDITNYVMIMLGQPMHAFDAKLFKEKKIIVRNALENEEMITLDNKKFNLKSEDILITSNNKPVALAGIMGGLNSSINDDTTDIILEAAYFDPKQIRKTSKRLGIKTDSSTRFEKKTDYNITNLALDFASYLVLQTTSGNILKGIKECSNFKEEVKVINHKLDILNKETGLALTITEVKQILDSLRFVNECNGNDIKVNTLSRRPDINTWQDINEEVLRIYGYENVKEELPVTAKPLGYTLKQKRVNLLKDYFSNNLFNEVYTYTLLNEDNVGKYNVFNYETTVIANPLSLDRKALRLSLLNNLLEVVKYNVNRGIENIKIFEIGKVFNEDEDEYLSGCVKGNFYNSLKSIKEDNFYIVKDIINNVFKTLDVDFSYLEFEHDSFNPYKTAKIINQGKQIGLIGYLNPINLDKELKDVLVFEINISKILNKQINLPEFKEINKFPKSTRDLSFVLDKDIKASYLLDKIKSIAKKRLTDIKIFDIYEDEVNLKDKKSVSVSLTFEDFEKTLDSSEIDNIINKILKTLNEENIVLRS